MHIAEEGFI